MSLSSGEAEIKACVRGLVEALYVSNVLKEVGTKHELHIYTDSSASLGHCSHIGNGKTMRHLEGAEMWIQQVLRAGRARMHKINGKQNPADLFTKYLPRDQVISHMSVLGFRLLDEDGNECGIKDLDREFGDDAVIEQSRKDDEHDASVEAIFRSLAQLCDTS